MSDLLTKLPPRSIWYGWGDPKEVHSLPGFAWDFLGKEIGAKPFVPPLDPIDLEDVEFRQSRLAEKQVLELEKIVGEKHVKQDKMSRAEHVGGKSYQDMYRTFHGIGLNPPDAVIFPADANEIAEILSFCVTEDIAVVPFGGGTSVVGGLDNNLDHKKAVIVVDLRRMNKMLSLDDISRTATFEPGMRGPEIEAALKPHGMTLGHYPQSHQQASLGGYVATRSAGQASSGYGRIDENVLGIKMVTTKGIISLGNNSPASAAGPKLMDIMVGSEGTYGIITEATLAVHPLPTNKRYGCWSFPSFLAAVTAFRRLSQELGREIIPQVCRLSDVDESRAMLTMARIAGKGVVRYGKWRGQDEMCVAIFVWEDTSAKKIRWRKKTCERVLRSSSGVRLPSVVAKIWEKGRFSGPYMRDELFRHRIFAETMETATNWSRIPALHDGVRQAILDTFAEYGTPGFVQCHISHIYPTGSSLYFIYAAREAADPIAQCDAVKAAAIKVMEENHATITHHHSVGTMHRPFMTQEVGKQGIEVLRAIKDELDPTDIMNPGKLVPGR